MRTMKVSNTLNSANQQTPKMNNGKGKEQTTL
jgi:hypothetical protein